MKFIFKILLSLSMLSAILFAAVDINTATKDELMSLHGIGETKANSIIEYRQTHKFKQIDDIKNVKGIGNKIFDGIKNDIEVGSDMQADDNKSK